MTKPYVDHAQALVRQEKALEEAKQRLAARGVYYPVCDSRISDAENYGRLLSYSEQEAAEIVKILREPSGPRPLELDNVAPKKDWGEVIMTEKLPDEWWPAISPLTFAAYYPEILEMRRLHQHCSIRKALRNRQRRLKGLPIMRPRAFVFGKYAKIKEYMLEKKND